MVKNLPENPGDKRDAGSIPGSGKSHIGNATHSSTLAWKISRTEESDGQQSMGL